MSNEYMNSAIYHSAGFTVYPQLGKIEIAEQKLNFGPVNMQVLLTLLQNQGEVISRAEFYEQVWGKQIVSDDALTRCISDLRLQLGKYVNNSALIETLPKRGYRWLPEVQLVEQVQEQIEVQKTPETISSQKKFSWQQYLIWTLASMVLLFITYTALFSLLSQSQQTRYIQIAVMPVQISKESHQALALSLEDFIHGHLLTTEHLRFLSNGAISNGLQNPYPYFFRELDAQWVIEAQVREQDNGVRIALSLVDARTGLVTFTKRDNFSNNKADLNAFSREFINELSELLKSQ